MSKLIFDGSTHQLSLVDDNGAAIGTWAAYNNVDSHATIRYLENKTYDMQDTKTPRHHKPNANGPYGSHGIVRFNVPHHPGIGVHSGRANARHKPGPEHATMGCIRTTDAAMEKIVATMKTSPLTTIEVKNNAAPTAHYASQRLKNKHLHENSFSTSISTKR